MTLLLTNAHLATMADGYGAIRDGALLIDGATIAYAGPRANAPASDAEVDCEGAWITPGLIDPHTHLIYGGQRAAEWEARLNGADYATIAQQGGGILSTVRATREASDDILYRSARGRMEALCVGGVTTIEIKSGYGLDLATEVRMLRLARRLGTELPVTVRTTFLGAHTVPPEFADDADAYVRLLCEEMLPQISAEGLADAVDAFCETIAFTPEQTERVFRAARALGLPVKLHADQLSDGGGAELAARYGALSADHLEYTSERGIAALAHAGTVAIVLPGAYYFLREKQPPPIGLLRAHGVPIAIASDCNPGTSPLVSLPLAMNFACTLLRLTPLEALRGVTVNAARALGLADRGTLAAGMRADLAVWSVREPAEIPYMLGANFCESVYVGGQRGLQHR